MRTKIARWTSGGWGYVTPTEGMAAFTLASNSYRVFKGGAWQAAAAVTIPTDGSVVDVELRQSVDSLLQQSRSVGVIST